MARSPFGSRSRRTRPRRWSWRSPRGLGSPSARGCRGRRGADVRQTPARRLATRQWAVAGRRRRCCRRGPGGLMSRRCRLPMVIELIGTALVAVPARPSSERVTRLSVALMARLPAHGGRGGQIEGPLLARKSETNYIIFSLVVLVFVSSSSGAGPWGSRGWRHSIWAQPSRDRLAPGHSRACVPA